MRALARCARGWERPCSSGRIERHHANRKARLSFHWKTQASSSTKRQLESDLEDGEEYDGLHLKQEDVQDREHLLEKYLRSMRRNGQRRNTGGVVRDLRTIQSLGVELDKEHFKVALEAFANAKDAEKCEELFRLMLRKGGSGVDESSCTTVVRCLGKSGKLNSAFELVDELENKRVYDYPKSFQKAHILGSMGLASPRSVLDALLDACAEQGELMRARAVMRRMRSRMLGGFHGWKRREFNLLIKAAARSGDPTAAFLAAGEMRTHGISPDACTYNTLLHAVSRGAGGYREGRALLVEMRSRAVLAKNYRLLPDALSYTCLLACLISDKSMEDRFKILEQLEEEMCEDVELRLDAVARAAVIDACLALGRADAGLSYLNKYVGWGQSVRGHAYMALMRNFASNKDAEMVRYLKERMKKEAQGKIRRSQIEEAEKLLEEAAASMD